MKFIFDRDEMIKEIAIAQEIIAIKNALSILSNVLLTAENDTLTIRATDTKVSFQTKIPVNVEEEGITTIFCDKFMSILNSLPSGEIEFEQNDIKVIIKPLMKKVKFQIKSMSSDSFPVFNTTEDIPFFEFPADEFKEMVAQTVFAVSNDETRFFMNGVFFEKKEDSLNLVATDGRRLAFISKNLCEGIDSFPSAIVPPKILSILMKRLPSEGLFSMAITEKNIYLKFGSYEFSSVLIDGQFPNYTRVIPSHQEFYFEIDKKDLTEALKRVALLVEQKSRRIYFKISPGVLSITSQESEMGAADEEIPCEYSGDDVSIALNYVYVEEPMKYIHAERIRIEFTEPMRAITVKPVPESDYFHIIMPMQG